MPPTNFPIRWETTGHQWWYASPIDWAAANGHYDLVRELLHIDTNLIFRLTSLRRIRRLEMMWDDDPEFDDVAQNRSQVAQKLLMECENKNGHNSLVGSGYGGWLLYTAASAGDLDFVKKLLERDSLLVFGEGEYGVTDIFYAAARSKNSEVFKLLIEFSSFWRHSSNNGGEGETNEKEVSSLFKFEMMNRAVHAAAKGGNLEVLKELLGDCPDVLIYKDSQESTLLHTASGRGQIEIVQYLISSFGNNTISSKDKQGNTALHVAAYRGYLAVIEVLISASPSSISAVNNYGDTLLHMAVVSFRTPGFRRQDRHLEFMKQLVWGNVVNVRDIINVQNNEGKTALHMAITENIHSDLVELLMKIPEISFSIRDASGRTPLDLIKQRQQYLPSSEFIKKQLFTGHFRDCTLRRMLVSHMKLHGIRGSPGSSFRVSDAKIMYLKDGQHGGATKRDYIQKVALSNEPTGGVNKPKLLESKRFGSFNNAAKHLKTLLQWPMRTDRKIDSNINIEGDNDFVDSYNGNEALQYSQASLRQRFSRHSSLPNNKRVTHPCLSDFPSPSSNDKFNKGLRHDGLKMTPQFDVESHSSSSSESSRSSDVLICREKEDDAENDIAGPSCKSASINRKNSEIDAKHVEP